MTDDEVGALFDAHDALVRACIDRALAFDEFVAAYGAFPQGYGLDESSSESRAVLARAGRRIAFHREVAGVLSGVSAGPSAGTGPAGGIEDFLPRAAFLRLRQLLLQYPDFKADIRARREF
jgi:hypothetical protein